MWTDTYEFYMANANLFSLTLYCAGVKRLNVQMDVQAEILQTNVKQMLQSATGMGIWTKRGFSVLPGNLCSIL